MGRNTTSPPCSRGAIIRLEAAWRHRLTCAGEGPLLSVTDDDRYQTALLIWPSCAMCRGASDNIGNMALIPIQN